MKRYCNPTQLEFPFPSLTKQSAQNECDVGVILDRYVKTGSFDHVNGLRAQYGDFQDVQDYHASLNQIAASEALFDALPAKVRSRFDNDPAKMLMFVDDPSNLEEMRELGLADPKAPSDEGPKLTPSRAAPPRSIDLEKEAPEK